MPDWNSRLAVSYVAADGSEGEISPIDSFSPSFSLNAEPLHSLEATHVGVVYTPQAMTFSMTVKAIGDVAARLTVLALDGTRFDPTSNYGGTGGVTVTVNDLGNTGAGGPQSAADCIRLRRS